MAKLGLDVEKYHLDIKRIVMGRLQPGRYGLDPEDVVQQVCAQILHKNQGNSPFDPDGVNKGRGGVSTYIFLVGKSTIVNMANRNNRSPLSDHKRLSLPDEESEERVLTNVTAEPAAATSIKALDDWIIAEYGSYSAARDVVQVGRHLLRGRDMKNISRILGLSRTAVKICKTTYTELAREWQEKTAT